MMVLSTLLVFTLSGCGDKSSQGVFSADSGGVHLAGWLPAGHRAAAAAGIESCTECHGGDFSGGISRVSCTRCHLGNQQSVHPLAWGNLVYARHPDYVIKNGTSACANIYCHGANLAGVVSSGPSCTRCHIGGQLAVHPSGVETWLPQPPGIPGAKPAPAGSHGAYVKQFASTASCQNAVCHGANLKGVDQSGLSCQACHSASLYTQYMK
jgi:hypothetical protein